jgi:hypothetical protein
VFFVLPTRIFNPSLQNSIFSTVSADSSLRRSAAPQWTSRSARLRMPIRRFGCAFAIATTWCARMGARCGGGSAS